MGRKQLLNTAGCLLRQAVQGSARSANTPALEALPIFDLQRSMAASRCFLTTYARSSAVLGMHLLPKRDIRITKSVLGFHIGTVERPRQPCSRYWCSNCFSTSFVQVAIAEAPRWRLSALVLIVALVSTLCDPVTGELPDGL